MYSVTLSTKQKATALAAAHTHTHTPFMHNYLDSQNGPPKFVKRPFKYESLKLTALNSTVGRFHILASNEFQTAGAMELKARALTNMFQIGSWDFQLFLT